MADTQFSLAAFMRLPMQQKLLSIIALSMVAAIVVAGWTWTRTPTFAVLFTNISERDGGNIIAYFQNLIDGHAASVQGAVSRPNLLNFDHFGRGWKNIWLEQ